MIHRLLRAILFLIWLELGLVLILLPWSEIWELNYFLYQYPQLGFIFKNPFLRGAVSGLGVMNVFLALESYRHRAPAVVTRTQT
jgi:hypothetical protein